MAYEINNLQLIDFSEEDDNLIAFHFHDSLHLFPLPGTFDNVISHVQSEFVEPKRPSLDWDSALFTCEGLLNTEALCMINKGFKKAESDLEILEAELFKDVKPDFHKLTKRSKVATNMTHEGSDNFKMENKTTNAGTDLTMSKSNRKKIMPVNTKLTASPSSVLSPLSSSSTSPASSFHNAMSASDFQSQTFEERKLTSQHATKSSIIRKIKSTGFQMPCPNESRKENVRRFQDKVSGLSRHLEDLGSDLTEVKGQLSCVKLGQLSLPATAEHTCLFSACKKMNIGRKISSRNIKPTISPSSVLSPLSPTCSSSTSSACSFHNPIPTPDLQTHSHASCHKFEERKLTSQFATRSFRINIGSSGLQMPSPRIGFFD